MGSKGPQVQRPEAVPEGDSVPGARGQGKGKGREMWPLNPLSPLSPVLERVSHLCTGAVVKGET